MSLRTTSRIVTFRRPFQLSAMEHRQPAGTYTVDTDEERLDTATVPAYRRCATSIRLPVRSGAVGSSEVVMIDPAELEAALVRDAAPEPFGPETLAEHTARIA